MLEFATGLGCSSAVRGDIAGGERQNTVRVGDSLTGRMGILLMTFLSDKKKCYMFVRQGKWLLQEAALLIAHLIAPQLVAEGQSWKRGA